MNIKKLLLVCLLVVLLQGCDRQKSHQEFMDDLVQLTKRYEECLETKVAQSGDTFCKYILESPQEMDELIKLGFFQPRELGKKVLNAQQKIDELEKANNKEDASKLLEYKAQLKRGYLVLKMLSSIR